LIALLTANRRENTFSRLPFVDLIREFVAFFERDIVEPTQYSLYCLNKQITSLVTMRASEHDQHGAGGLTPEAPRRTPGASGELPGLGDRDGGVSGRREPRVVRRDVGDDQPPAAAVVVDRGHDFPGSPVTDCIGRWRVTIHIV
jgi:hypothetical protein